MYNKLEVTMAGKSKNLTLKNRKKIKEAHPFAIVSRYNLKSIVNVVRILLLIDPPKHK